MMDGWGYEPKFGIYYPLTIKAMEVKNGMNCAQIDNGVVVNICFVGGDNIDAFPNFVKCGEKPVAIGDTYADGKFYRDGEEVLSEKEQLVAALELLGYTEAVTDGK